MSIISDIEQWFSDMWTDVNQLCDFATDCHALIDILAEDIEKQFEPVTTEVTGLIEDLATLKESIHDLGAGTKVIRADKVIDLVHDLIGGELLSWLKDEFSQAAPTLTNALGTASSAFTELASAKAESQPSLSNLSTSWIVKMVNGVLAITKFWIKLHRIAVIINAVVPVLKDIRAKLKEVTGFILPQTGPRTKVTLTYRKRGA